MESKKLLAVTGNPVLHSKSPLMFNHVFSEGNIDATYFRLAADTAAEAMFLFREAGLTGMNVTAPFKKDIMEEVDHLDPAAIKIGGINTIARNGEGISGFNTDHIGVARSIEEIAGDLKGKRCVVLGAGGAGRAAAYGLLNKGARVVIANRTLEKAEHTAEQLGCEAAALDGLRELVANADVLVSSLSSGVEVVKKDWLHPGLVVLDANYKSSTLAKDAVNRGCPLAKGEDWLLFQAIPAYTHFLGETPPFNWMKQALDVENPLPSKRSVISLTGFMGTGKSSVAKILADKLDYQVIDADSLIEKETGITIPEIFSSRGEERFRQMEKELLNRLLDQNLEKTVISWGGGIVLDQENRQKIKENSLSIWLFARPWKNLSLIKDGSRPLLNVDDPGETARKIFLGRRGYYAETADLMVNSDCEHHNPDSIAEKIYEEICKTF